MMMIMIIIVSTINIFVVIVIIIVVIITGGRHVGVKFRRASVNAEIFFVTHRGHATCSGMVS